MFGLNAIDRGNDRVGGTRSSRELNCSSFNFILSLPLSHPPVDHPHFQMDFGWSVACKIMSFIVDSVSWSRI